MNYFEPINQQKLFGLKDYLFELIRLYQKNIFPNKLLLSGSKGFGKSTLAYHFINFVLSQNEEHKYDLKNFEIKSDSKTFKTILNKTNTNFTLIDISPDKKSIDINQIRELIVLLNKSSLNNKPRFVLVDNIEHLNINSINALLKILEEPNENIYFILINSNKKIAPTLLSRCINFKINLTHNECIEISNKLFNKKLENIFNKDLLNYYFSPGHIYRLSKFANENKYDLLNINLNQFLRLMIKENYYKKDPFIKYIIFDFVEFYFTKLNKSFSQTINEKYSYFIKRFSDTKKYNLDEESLFIEFEEKILNG